MSTSFGTGQPLWFKCRKCRGMGVNGKPVVTGRFKKESDHRHLRRGRYKVEYKCDYCKYVGWSTHVDAERQLIEAGFVKD